MPRFNDKILDWIDAQDPWALTKKVMVLAAFLFLAGALIVRFR